MKKNFIKYSAAALFLFFVPLIFTGCGSTNQENENTTETPEQIEPAPEEWHQIASIEELTGTWKTVSGKYYEFPFYWNGKTYLHYSDKKSDDTAKWIKYANDNYTTVQDLWNKRYAVISKIYNNDYPYALSNGTEFGIKLTYSKNRIYSTYEILIPYDVAAMNTSFFRISTYNNMMEVGYFNFNDTTGKSIYADGMIYSKYDDYWKN